MFKSTFQMFGERRNYALNYAETCIINMQGREWGGNTPLLKDNSLIRSFTFLHVLKTEALTVFIPDYLHKDNYTAVLEERDSISLWRKGQV